jgi:hypothetical protein
VAINWNNSIISRCCALVRKAISSSFTKVAISLDHLELQVASRRSALHKMSPLQQQQFVFLIRNEVSQKASRSRLSHFTLASASSQQRNKKIKYTAEWKISQDEGGSETIVIQ